MSVGDYKINQINDIIVNIYSSSLKISELKGGIAVGEVTPSSDKVKSCLGVPF